MANQDPKYTVFVRLPFPRGDFVDPPAVEWDASKDKTLWKILSKASKNSDIDWNELASKFEVTLPFLLQQAAWLYERQLLQVRAQMRKVGATKGGGSSAPSPVPGGESAGGESMKRTISGGGNAPRVASSLSNRKDSPVPPRDSGIQRSSNRLDAATSRASSLNESTTPRQFSNQTSPHPQHASLYRRALSPKTAARASEINTASTVEHSIRSARPAPLSPASETTTLSLSSSDSGPDNKYPVQSRMLRRPRFTTTTIGRNISERSEDGGDDEDDEEPAFLSFANTPSEPSQSHDPSATLRGDLRNTSSNRRNIPSHNHKKSTAADTAGIRSQTSDSSASTSSAAPTPIGNKGKRPEIDIQRERERRGFSGPGPLSPKRTAELAKREGSDTGTPSMGSSFSDLDDASVTQSALEEALASNMQAGGMTSRMSSISQALKSRYL